MALTVEDGSGVTGADSYVTLVEARAWALARGTTLSAVDAELEPLLVRATDYIGTLESRFAGSRVEAAQSLAWPRKDVVLYGEDLADNVIPPQVKNAQVLLAMDLANGSTLMSTGDGRLAIEETVGPITTRYADSQGSTSGDTPQAALSMLEPLFGTTGGFGLSSVRV